MYYAKSNFSALPLVSSCNYIIIVIINVNTFIDDNYTLIAIIERYYYSNRNETFDAIIIEQLWYQCFYSLVKFYNYPVLIGFLSVGNLPYAMDSVGRYSLINIIARIIILNVICLSF